ncbi:Cyclin [Macleaya cordata]|uniref:Cyclin n=1 Tax=Macleaya cordata TaxID=56857 RepID=A0A200PMH0_MACCD|nr:Cyclin [Macleaya cordata]
MRALEPCGSFSASDNFLKPMDPVPAIDQGEFKVSKEELDYCKLYKRRENLDQIGSMSHVSEELWMLVVDWLMQVHNATELAEGILYRTINIFGRYVSQSVNVIESNEVFQLGFTSMVLASKYEDISDSKLEELLSRFPKPNEIELIWGKESLIVEKLHWDFTAPNAYHFLALFIKVGTSYKKMEDMVFFLAELGLMHYGVIVMRLPSMFAASALYAARCTLREVPVWNETLERLTGYSESNIKELAKLMVRFHSEAANQNLKAVYNKYSDQKWSSVAFCEPAKDLLED